ncbi:MAG TPA: hypothetical protein PLL62_02220 [Candidatus Saccharicenans sp.]|nr:hypothetical protein [Candidatus Saccharicenans sp.]HQM74039.1 hypothetical protein [Candidatus Saccharicenans sp.]
MSKQILKTLLAFWLLMAFIGSLPAPGAEVKKADLEILKNLNFREIGPTRESGRFVDIAWNEKEPNTFYCATGSGGLWKTTNNGISFEALFTNEPVFSLGEVEVAPSDPSIVWIGTGEATNSRSTYWGNGVYKSTDAGKTWTHMGLDESHHIGAIVIHPKNPDIVYVAALGHLYSENPERGLYKTENGGKTWEKVLEVVVKGKHIGVVDCVMDPANPDILYAATYDKVRKPYTFNLGGPGSRIYKTTDAGKTWTMLEGGLPMGMLGRIGIAVYAKNPNILYATIENANKPGMSDEDRYQELLQDKSSEGMIGGEVYHSDDAGKTWRKVSPDGQSIGGDPGYYYGKIIIDPNNDQIVHVLSAASWGTYDGGKTWKRQPLGFGGDDHALWIDPRDSNHIVIGYDHGIGFTYDGGRNWYHPDFLPLSQFYAVGFDYSYPYRVAGGLQDNGSHLGPGTKRDGSPIQFEDWYMVGGGDGMYNEFDWKTNCYLYNESQFGTLQRVDLKTGERKSIAYGRQDQTMRWNWCSPVLVSPHNSDVIYHGGNKLVKSPFRGEYWEVISPDLTTNDPKFLTTGKGGDGNMQYCTITTIDESPLVEGLLWVGTDDGNVWVTRDGGKNWTKLNENIKGNPGYWVSRVAASYYEPGVAYVSYSGFRQDDFRPFLYKTTDYGKTWTSIASNLPNEPINVIREHPENPNLLFVGTDFAVHVSFDGGQSWTRFKNNMPTQPVHDLKLHPRENDLIVATHGRGIFIADIYPLKEINNQVVSKDIHLFEIEPRVKWVNRLNPEYAYNNFEGQSEPLATTIYYYLKNKADKEVKISIYKGNVLVNEIKGTNEAGINKVLWDWTSRKERSEESKKRVQEMLKRYAEYGYTPRGRNLDVNYEYLPAPAGDYLVVLKVGDKSFSQTARLLLDSWSD